MSSYIISKTSKSSLFSRTVTLDFHNMPDIFIGPFKRAKTYRNTKSSLSTPCIARCYKNLTNLEKMSKRNRLATYLLRILKLEGKIDYVDGNWFWWNVLERCKGPTYSIRLNISTLYIDLIYIDNLSWFCTSNIINNERKLKWPNSKII